MAAYLASQGRPLPDFMAGDAVGGRGRSRECQNLPGDWQSPDFNLAQCLESAIGGIHVMIHNDAVVQGLSQLPSMHHVNAWGAITIGTGLGTAHYKKVVPEPSDR